MGSIRYNVSAGVLPITVDLIGASYSDSHTLYVYGEDTFYNVPLGTYVLLFTGDDGCTEESGPIYVVECTTTTTTTEEVYYYYANFYLCGCDNIGMNQPIKSYTPLEIGKFYFLDDIFGFDKIIEIVSEGGDGSELTFEPDGGPYNSCEETSLAECPTTTTTSTTCYLYRFFECGVYSIVNNTDEFVEFLYRDCYEEEWFGSIWLAPHGTSYYNPDCMEYMTYNCYLDVTLNNICTTTTTSTTICELAGSILGTSCGDCDIVDMELYNWGGGPESILYGTYIIDNPDDFVDFRNSFADANEAAFTDWYYAINVGQEGSRNIYMNPVITGRVYVDGNYIYYDLDTCEMLNGYYVYGPIREAVILHFINGILIQDYLPCYRMEVAWTNSCCGIEYSVISANYPVTAHMISCAIPDYVHYDDTPRYVDLSSCCYDDPSIYIYDEFGCYVSIGLGTQYYFCTTTTTTTAEYTNTYFLRYDSYYE